MYGALSRWFRDVAESGLSLLTSRLYNPDHLIRYEEIEELGHLSDQQRTDLIAFMEALAGEGPPDTGPPDGEMAYLDVPAESLARGCFRSALKPTP